jgi:hypothetical protein
MPPLDTAPWIDLAPGATPAEARKRMRRKRVQFVVVGEKGRPAWLLSEAELGLLDEAVPLHDQAHRLPLPTFVEDIEDVPGVTLKTFAAQLQAGGASGLIVLGKGAVMGVVSAEAIAGRLERLDVEARGGGGLYGVPMIPATVFTCPECGRHLVPRFPDPPPLCPVHHIPMTSG